MLTKSGLMLGLGESRAEVEQLLRDLRAVDCDVVTIGQYLQPTRRNLPVVEYLPPETFASYRDYGLSLGFQAVFSGPLVRSSYMAEQVFDSSEAEGAIGGLQQITATNRERSLFLTEVESELM